jgi:hypothetical protein
MSIGRSMMVDRPHARYARESTIINDGIKGTEKKELKT